MAFLGPEDPLSSRPSVDDVCGGYRLRVARICKPSLTIRDQRIGFSVKTSKLALISLYVVKKKYCSNILD
jgi:hypothetical protein